MFNPRPIDDPKMQRALNAIRATMESYGFAGAVMLVGEKEAAYTYVMHAPWSAIRRDRTQALGFRIRASVEEDGVQGRRTRLEGATHTVCQLADFGAQTMDWMEQLKMVLRQAGVQFDHNSFGGQPLPTIGVREPPPPPDAA